jgi:hypothetical protein
MTEKLYVIYDDRALLIDTDDCAVLESCSSLADVRRSDFDGQHGPLGVVFEYDVENGNELVNEQYLGTVADLKAQQVVPSK